MKDSINSDLLKKLITEKNVNVEVYDSVESTNKLLTSRAAFENEQITLAVAASQTGGRGRLGRSFYSPGGTGLYMSVRFVPDIKPTECLTLTTSAALAVCLSIESVFGVKPSIKWVNDIYENGKKVAGILAQSESAPGGNSLLYAVVGIGINIIEPENGFPDDVKNIAGAVLPFSEYTENSRERLCAEIVNRLFALYRQGDDDNIFNEYKKRLFVVGKAVTVLKPSEKDYKKDAKIIALNRDYSLTAQFEDGGKERLTTGEISLKMHNPSLLV